jgi:two-component system, chemotaxis family, sensor kinase CheA
MIMKGGLSTTRTVDQVSGRGIGLDVVRETVTKLRAEVTVRSESGAGTSMEICVPVSVSSLVALQIDAGGTIASLPLYSVRQVLRVADTDIVRSAEKQSIVYDDKIIPFLPLTTALQKKPATRRKLRPWSAVVVESPSGLAAIGVDGLLGATSIVVRPLPSFAPSDPIIAGASLGAEGNPEPFLDAEGLVAAACLDRPPAVEAAELERPSILVIDDSLTTRMLEQSILESAGYRVEVATSAEEGLGKARLKDYGLFLVDVEMPGMSGFEFVSSIQSDAVLHKVPAILVTSRNAPEDRRRGEEVGARAYIVKGEFDQRELLQRVRECIG